MEREQFNFQKRSIFTAAFLVFMGMTCSAGAQENYADVSVGAALLKLPETRFFRIQTDDWKQIQDIDSGDGNLNGVQFAGTFGFRRDTTFMSANKLDFSLHGEIMSVSTTETGVSERTADSPYRYGWVVIDNEGAIGTPLEGNTLVTSIDRDVEMYRLEPRIGVSYELKPDVSATFFVGPSVRYLDQRNTYAGNLPDFTLESSLREDITTSYLGGVSGIAIAGRFNDDWSGSLNASVSAYSASTDYKGDYEDNLGWASSPASRQLDDTELALGADLKLAIDYKVLPTVTLGFYVAAQYLSYTPEVAYGAITSNGFEPNGEDLHLEDADLYGYAGGIRMTVNF